MKTNKFRKIRLISFLLIVASLIAAFVAAVALPASAHSTTATTTDRTRYHLLVDWSKRAHVKQLPGAVTCPTITEPSTACTKQPDTVDFDVNVVGATPNGWFDLDASSLKDQCTSLTFSPVGEFFGDAETDSGDLGDIHLNRDGDLHIHAHGTDCNDGKYSVEIVSDVFDGKHYSVNFTIVD